MTSPTGRGIDRIKIKKDKDRVDDLRFSKSGLKKCIQCGRCTASCPAAYMYEDFRPRDIMRRLLLGELHSREMGGLIWKCGQCYSCRARCPRNCSAGACVIALRAESVQKGTAPEDILRISDILKDNLYSKGETFLPTTLDHDLLRELGIRTYERCSGNMEKRARLGYLANDARRTPIPEGSLEEIRGIMRLTGYLGEIK